MSNGKGTLTTEAGQKGGRSRSEAKRDAARVNVRVAREAKRLKRLGLK